MMSCVGFEVYKFLEPPFLAQQFFQSPPFRCLKIFGAPPQYLHPPPVVILNELSLRILIYKNYTLDELNFEFNTFFVTFPSFEPFLDEILVKIWNTREISTMQQITILVPCQQKFQFCWIRGNAIIIWTL